MFDEIWTSHAYLPAGWGDRGQTTVIDVGANVGVFTVWASRVLRPGRIVAIEPSPEAVVLLRRNLKRNGVTRTTVAQFAVAGHRGTATLYRRGAPSMNTLFQHDRYGSHFEPVADVPLLTLDNVMDRYGIERCDLLKLDCEGAEYQALFGASKETLAKITNIVGEYHEGMSAHGSVELMTFLERQGFEVIRFPAMDEEGGHFCAARPTQAIADAQL